jgi:hypothetical protein
MGLFDFLKRKPSAPVSANEPLIPGAPAVDLYAFRGKPEEYFSRLLQGCFPEYEIQSNVHPSTLTQLSGSAWICRCGNRNYSKFCVECGKPQPENHYPISFLLYRNGTPALAIVLCDKNRANVRRTIQACQSIGLPCQCYYTHFRNKASYVTDRIRTDLR